MNLTESSINGALSTCMICVIKGKHPAALQHYNRSSWEIGAPTSRSVSRMYTTMASRGRVATLGHNVRSSTIDLASTRSPAAPKPSSASMLNAIGYKL